MLDPYDVLGIPKGSNRDLVKKAYRKMIQRTHPDKMGNAKYFMMVHEAYQAIEAMYKTSQVKADAPKHKMAYTASNDTETPTKPFETFSNDKFNKFFEKNKINGHDPYTTHGYGNMMCERLKYQEDIADMKNKRIKSAKRSLVVYKEPEAINQQFSENYAQLGVSKVQDFSCNSGTDYLKAYMGPDQYIDTVKRYDSVEHMKSERANTDFRMTQDEIKQSNENEKNLRYLEQIRLQHMRHNDSRVHSQYTALNNRLR